MTGQVSPTEQAKWTPTPKQVAVLRAQQEGGYGESIFSVCKRARVDRKSWYNWMEGDPDFKKEWEEAPFRELKRHLVGPFRALVRRASRGDVPAMRLFFEMTGFYCPSSKSEVSGGLTLEQLILQAAAKPTADSKPALQMKSA